MSDFRGDPFEVKLARFEAYAKKPSPSGFNNRIFSIQNPPLLKILNRFGLKIIPYIYWSKATYFVALLTFITPVIAWYEHETEEGSWKHCFRSGLLIGFCLALLLVAYRSWVISIQRPLPWEKI